MQSKLPPKCIVLFNLVDCRWINAKNMQSYRNSLTHFYLISSCLTVRCECVCVCILMLMLMLLPITMLVPLFRCGQFLFSSSCRFKYLVIPLQLLCQVDICVTHTQHTHFIFRCHSITHSLSFYSFGHSLHVRFILPLFSRFLLLSFQLI